MALSCGKGTIFMPKLSKPIRIVLWTLFLAMGAVLLWFVWFLSSNVQIVTNLSDK